MILDERKKISLHRTAGLIEMVAGADLIFSSFMAGSVLQSLFNGMSGPFQYAQKLSFTLDILLGLGGVAVLASGYFTYERKYPNLSLLWVGGGMGVVLTIASALESFALYGYAALLNEPEYLAGAVLTLAAIWLARESAK